MKRSNFLTKMVFLIIAAGLLLSGCTSDKKEPKAPADYVNPYIGTIGHMLTATSPSVYLPHGEISLVPRTTPGITDRYLADKIYNFPGNAFTLMATTGDITLDNNKNASRFDHDAETCTPYYYSVLLEDNDINVEYTLTDHAIYYRFTCPEAGKSNILLSMTRNTEIEIIGDNAIKGKQSGSFGRGGGASGRGGGAGGRGSGASGRGGGAGGIGSGAGNSGFYAVFSKPFKTHGVWNGSDIKPDSVRQSGNGIGVYLTYSTAKAEIIELKVGFSRDSVQQAKKYLEEEIPGWDFEKVKDRAREVWNKALNKIKITGGTEDQRTIFYTALYRTMGRKSNVWDTYRCAYPLQTIIEPEINMQVIRDFIHQYEETGWLPSSGAMIGNHSTPVIVDAYMKNLRNFDIEKAYAGMKKNAMEATMIPWRDRGPLTELDKVYFEKGFFPALPLGKPEWVEQVNRSEKRQSVSVTLEHCYDDWCLAQMAKALGKTEDYEYFMKRAANYQNLFDSRVGFMAPKTADGNWVFKNAEEFDPIWSGGQGGRDYYTEMNAWSYTFHVQHDVAGLINLIGGREKFVAKLDALFQQQFRKVAGSGGSKYSFLGQFPDMTGLIGQYSQGNEPSLHIPYLYNYVGEPWKTQRRLREIMEIWYNAGPFGICGDEDGGAMSSWYVFTAMGFYPVCPGQAVYNIGCPIFNKVEIDVGKGKTFVIEAKGVSSKNNYIQSALLNGKPLNKPWFSHSDLVNGGTLVLQMDSSPNKSWGSAPEDAPPSMTSGSK
jgi:putative alpha-1,2-mannosidase